MRHPLETAPIDGRTIILADDLPGTSGVADYRRWPTSPLERRLIAVSAIVLIVALSMCHQAGFTALAQGAVAASPQPAAGEAEVRRALDEERARSTGLKNELAAAQRENELQADQLRKINDEVGQLKQAAASTAEILERERQKAAIQAKETAALRQELGSSAAKYRQALDEEYARQALQWSELAAAQREGETRAAQLRKAKDELGQLKQVAAADRTQDLQRERAKSASLADEAAAARKELTENTAQYRQALDEERARSTALTTELISARRENEAQTAQLSKTREEMAQLAKATEKNISELRQSVRKEHDRAEAMAREVESAQRSITMSINPDPERGSVGAPAKATEPAAKVPPQAAEAPESQEAARLIARARTLLGQGNIVAARTVLERAVESGSARASFTLAETYDPAILSSWGTYGTRGDANKARELYAKAQAGGIQDAKDRLEQLSR